MPPLEIEDRTVPIPESAGMAPPPLIRTGDLLDNLLGDLAARHKTQEGGGWTGGIRCGLQIVDKELRGFRGRSVTILNAPPNAGKSTLANQIAYLVANFQAQKVASVYVTFENDPTDLLLKQLSRCSGWEVNDLLDGKIAPDDFRLRQAAADLAKTPLFYLRGNSACDARIIIERGKEARSIVGADSGLFIVIDYLQYFARFIRAKGQLEQLAVALAEMREIADELGAALLVIGSQSREANKGKDATMYGSRGSGEIEYDADVLLSLTEDETRLTEAGIKPRKLTIVKSRYGGAGEHRLYNFRHNVARFEELISA